MKKKRTEYEKELEIKYLRINFVVKIAGTTLVVSVGRLRASNAGGPRSIPGKGTRSCILQLRPSAVQINNKYLKNKNKISFCGSLCLNKLFSSFFWQLNRICYLDAQEDKSGTVFSGFLSPESLTYLGFTRVSYSPIENFPVDSPCSGTEILCGSLSSDLSGGWAYK